MSGATPLVHAEAYLRRRQASIERRLPPDGEDSPLWDEYVRVVQTLTAIRAQLYGPSSPRRSA
jgi:hypothetical protein